MKSISLYVNNGCWLNRVHPYTKLLYVLAAVTVPLIAGRIWFLPVTIACSLVLLGMSRLLKKALPLAAFSFTLIIAIFLIQGLFYHQNASVLFRLGPLVFYREGVRYATGIGLNILNMLLSFAVFILTTSPQELVEELERSGFSPKFGYIIISVFQILPQMMMTKDTITDAQRSRGMETEGKLSVRAKAFLPLISPVVMSSLINTRERAIALEVRGFGRKGRRSFLTQRVPHKGDRAVGAAMVVLIVLTVIWRIVCR